MSTNTLNPPVESAFVGELLFLKMYPSGWGVGKVKLDQRKLSVNGAALKGLKEHSVYEFHGQMSVDPKYGEQLKVSRVSVYVPEDRFAIVRYLMKNYSGVGEKTAEKFVDYHVQKGGSLQNLRQVILDNPFAIDFSVVSNRKTASKDKGGVRSAIYRQFASRLGGLDTSDGVFRALAVYYEKRFSEVRDPMGSAWSEFTKNPYAPIREVNGYGFARADVLGRKLNYPSTAPARIAALATHAIDEGCTSAGHTYLTLGDFEQMIGNIDATIDVQDAIAAAQEMGEPIIVNNGRYYLKRFFEAEKFLGLNLSNRMHQSVDPLVNRLPGVIETDVLAAAKQVGIVLDESQLAAVIGILTSRQSVHSITAGPGCGKTAIMEVVVAVLIKHKKVGFAAPTGKAAKVLNSRVSKIGASASTIHSLLGVSEGGFIHHSNNPLDLDLLVIDETSMVDVSLMDSVFSAIKAKTHIVFLGDDQQLPSVGPGNCLVDILKMPFDHYRLTKTHRNHGGILEVVQMAGIGLTDFNNREDVRFIESLPEASAESVADLLHIYHQELQAVGGDFSQVGLLIARRKGDVNTPGWNTTYLNARLRDAYNSDGEKIPGFHLRINDRIILKKNISFENVDELTQEKTTHAVVNGDTGYVRGYLIKNVDVDGDSEIEDGMVEWVILELDDGRVINYPSTHMGVVDLAYAMTVHSAQGSEYKRLINVCINGSPGFVHRAILFTAWSRAQKFLTIIGEPDVIASVLRRPAPKRNSYLR
jgi:exodeoxyribonuclease V alpha subunit